MALLRYALAAVAAVSAAASVEPQLDRGNVLVHKQLAAPATQNILVVGKNFTATYYVFNMASAGCGPPLAGLCRVHSGAPRWQRRARSEISLQGSSHARHSALSFLGRGALRHAL